VGSPRGIRHGCQLGGNWCTQGLRYQWTGACGVKGSVDPTACVTKDRSIPSCSLAASLSSDTGGRGLEDCSYHGLGIDAEGQGPTPTVRFMAPTGRTPRWLVLEVAIYFPLKVTAILNKPSLLFILLRILVIFATSMPDWTRTPLRNEPVR